MDYGPLTTQLLYSDIVLRMENKNQTKNSVSNFTNLLEFFHIVENLKVKHLK